MKLSQIRATLDEIGVSPVKTLGQNFLHDQNLSRWIVERAGVGAGDFVLEIGPGLGALTEVALGLGARVLALEKDKRLADFLQRHLPNESLDVRHIDALEFDQRCLFAQPKVKLLGNLPYNITAPLLGKYLDFPSPISLALLMLQKEVAERICASPGAASYGALTLQLEFFYHSTQLRKVPPSVFLPQPEVESALVQISPRAPDEIPQCSYSAFRKLVRQGFAQRRKQLGKLLRDRVGDWQQAAAAAGIAEDARAETLSLQQWVALTDYVAPIRRASPEQSAAEVFPVVDENDRLIRTAPRGEVHANNLRHRAVHILVFDRNGEVYLQKRSRWKDRHPFVWDSSAAGHVDGHEAYDEAAVRELKEELGIEATLSPVAKLPASSATGEEFIQLYRAEHSGPIEPDPAEIDVGGFFPPDIVTEWISARPGDFAPGFVECWRAYHARSRTN